MYKKNIVYPGILPGYAPNLMRMIKLCTLILFFAILEASAISTHAQSIKINEKNAPLERVLNQIRTQSGYDLFYNQDLVRGLRVTNLTVKNATVEQALQKTLIGLPLSYSIDNRIVVISKAKPTSGIAADSTITGTVYDAKTREGLPGVTLRIKNTNVKAVSDNKGYYGINAKRGDVLQLTYVGFEAKDITINSSRLDIPIWRS